MAEPNQIRYDRARPRRVVVLLPCYNEEVTVTKVVRDFQRALPDVDIYVFDNLSDDNTAKVAEEAGAIVVSSPLRGKGNVVRHMFRAVDADLYVIADGDDTYPADMAGELIRVLVESGADMVIGTRLEKHDRHAFRSLHQFGNRLISKLVSVLFSTPVTDVLSGYRVIDHHLARTLYLQSCGFEIETEVTVQALVKNYVVREVPVRYGVRPPGSDSKLNTFSDGLLILKSILLVFKDYKPLVFFSSLAGIYFVLGLAAGAYPVYDYITTRYVSHVPLALLAAALEILAVLFFGIGLILNAVKRFHRENQELVGGLYRLMADKRDRQ